MGGSRGVVKHSSFEKGREKKSNKCVHSTLTRLKRRKLKGDTVYIEKASSSSFPLFIYLFIFYFFFFLLLFHFVFAVRNRSGGTRERERDPKRQDTFSSRYFYLKTNIKVRLGRSPNSRRHCRLPSLFPYGMTVITTSPKLKYFSSSSS